MFRFVLGVLVFLGFMVLAPASLQAFYQGEPRHSIYTVDKVDVDITGENAVMARDEAIKKAHEKAFDMLAERILPESEYATFTIPAYDQIERMVNGFQINQEKMASNRYIGRFSFRFQPDLVDRFFRKTAAPTTPLSTGGSGAQALTGQAPSYPVLVVPFYQTPRQTLLWETDNQWRTAWESYSGSLQPMNALLPVGDIEDLRDMPDVSIISSGRDQLLNAMNRYGADVVVVALYMDQEVENDRIFLFGYRNDPTFYLSETLDFPADSNLTGYTGAIEAVARMINTQMVAGQSAASSVTPIGAAGTADAGQNQTGAFNSQTLRATVYFRGLPQWVDMSTRLRGMASVDEINVISLQPDKADIELRYIPPLETVQAQLRETSLSLSALPTPDASGQTLYVINDATLR